MLHVTSLGRQIWVISDKKRLNYPPTMHLLLSANLSFNPYSDLATRLLSRLCSRCALGAARHLTLTSGSSSGTFPIQVRFRMVQSHFALELRSKCTFILLVSQEWAEVDSQSLPRLTYFPVRTGDALGCASGTHYLSLIRASWFRDSFSLGRCKGALRT